MGPALTHVSMKYGDSGWKHVTAEEAEALFPKQSVPAGTRQFICECCGQYVSFTKDGINVRHFKHSRGEEDKTCAERVARNAECEIVQYNTYDFPLRLALDDTDFNLSIGIPQCAIKTKDIKVTVQGKREGGHDYTIKNEAASGLVWLDLNKDIANSYKIKPESRYPNWPEIIAGINPAGTFFDSYGGRRLHEGDEVYAEHDYYMYHKTNRLCSCNYASCQIGDVRLLRGDNPLRLTPMSGGGQYVKDIVNSGTYSSAEEMFCLYGINGTNGEDITVKKSDSLVYVSVPKTDTQTRNIFMLYSWATSDSKIRAISVDAWPAIESILCDGGYHISHILD